VRSAHHRRERVEEDAQPGTARVDDTGAGEHLELGR